MPTLLLWLLIASAAVGVFALATFTLPYVGRRVQVGVLVLLALLRSLSIGMIRDLDRHVLRPGAQPGRDLGS